MLIPKLLLIPLTVGLITQTVKFIIQAAQGNFRWSILQEYGGMPSGHTALVVSLTTVVGLNAGVASTAFAICFVFSLIIIRDAVGLRQFIGLHGKTLNMLIKELPAREEKKFPMHLSEQLGHTPAQALVGGIIGFVLAWLLNGWIR